MASNVAIWPGSGSYDEVSSSTPFSFYDSEASFVTHSVQTATWAAKRLGYPVMDVELQGAHFYSCFEEAVTEYSAQVNQYNIKENLLNLQGSPTSSNWTHTLAPENMGRLISIAESYGQEADVGGQIEYHTASISVTSGSQVYDLQATFSESFADSGDEEERIEVKRVFHEASPAVTRYFDPYAGTGAGTINMMDQFGWSGNSPAITFTMMPLYADALRIQAIEMNDIIRKSAYTFELVNNKLRVFPIPTSSFTMFFHYILKKDRYNFDTGTGKQTDFSNIRYDNMLYGDINDVGKQWIRKYTLALSKEVLGLIRSKYGSIPIPGAETSLDGETLRSEAATEKESLITELREILEQASSQNLMEAESQESEHQQEIMRKIPLKIYIG